MDILLSIIGSAVLAVLLAAGMSYGQYVARYDPPKARPKPQKERYHDL